MRDPRRGAGGAPPLTAHGQQAGAAPAGGHRFPAAEARAVLAGHLARWREAAGLTQAQAGRRIGYSRSAIARAEATGICSRDFCLRAGRLYGAGDTLALAHDRIVALAAAARAQAARQARQSPPIAAEPEDAATAFTVTEAACPHCGKPVAVLMQHSAALLPIQQPVVRGPPGGQRPEPSPRSRRDMR